MGNGRLSDVGCLLSSLENEGSGILTAAHQRFWREQVAPRDAVMITQM